VPDGPRGTGPSCSGLLVVLAAGSVAAGPVGHGVVTADGAGDAEAGCHPRGQQRGAAFVAAPAGLEGVLLDRGDAAIAQVASHLVVIGDADVQDAGACEA